MAKNNLDEIFDKLALRVTSDVPATNYRVVVEDKETVKQDVKELFSSLAADVIKDQKTLKAFQSKVAGL